MVFYNPALWYVNGPSYFALPKRQQGFSYLAGEIVRQGIDPPVNNERAFICTFAGTTDGAATDATWNLTRGALTNDNTVRWHECTGQASLCGDVASTLNWTQAKALGSASIGAIIKRNNEASYQICTTAGSAGASEPAFNDTAGITTNDGTIVWTSLGLVTNYPKGKAAFPRLVSVWGTNWWAPGNIIYVSSNHTEIQPAQNISPPASLLLFRVLCHDVTGNYPPTDIDLRSSAVISSSQSIANSFKIQPRGPMYWHGINMRAAVGGSLGGTIFDISYGNNDWVQNYVYMEKCSLEIADTNANAYFQFGSGGNYSANLYLIMNNTTVKFGHALQYIQPAQVQWIWQNTLGAVIGPPYPSSLIKPSGSGSIYQLTLEALDLTTVPGAIYNQLSQGMGTVLIKDCKLNPSATIPTPATFGLSIIVENSYQDNSRLNTSKICWEGRETTDTVLVRAGMVVGPREFLQSRKVVTTANVRWERPFRCQPIIRWNDVLNAARTVTVYGNLTGGLDAPKNDEVWLEISYLGNAIYPQGTTLMLTKATWLSVADAGTPDDSVWNGAPIGFPFKLVGTFTSRMAGAVTFAVCVAKPSTTLYIDPVVKLV